MIDSTFETLAFQNADGWWFWDESWTVKTGPFESRDECKQELENYLKYLNGEL